MKPTRVLLAAWLATPLVALHAADLVLVDRGMPRAEMVVAESRPRMVSLAAFRAADERRAARIALTS